MWVTYSGTILSQLMPFQKSCLYQSRLLLLSLMWWRRQQQRTQITISKTFSLKIVIFIFINISLYARMSSTYFNECNILKLRFNCHAQKLLGLNTRNFRLENTSSPLVGWLRKLRRILFGCSTFWISSQIHRVHLQMNSKQSLVSYHYFHSSNFTHCTEIR